ncbi:hypothetical protein SteCoe_24464 [Stentor coeruleus]|uniref:Peptidase M14 domain-containing protein n=1 Tax=Stentor coeruleus TaxID=5963 RepID=A0A1R2BHG8_9CILI|nr:hypothetical protein SteCoe_24464 [Stentor coeruleus]
MLNGQLMVVWLLSLLVGLCSGVTFTGTLGGFLATYEVTQALDSLVNDYFELTTRDTSKGFDTLIVKNSTSLTEYKKPIIVISSGIHGGYPMGTYEVLFLASELLKSYVSGDKGATYILETSEIHFIPILNSEAYTATENAYNGSFTVFKTDLSNIAECAGAYDAGINPDHNFPFGWQPSNDMCSSDFSGNGFLTSIVSINIEKYFNQSDPSLRPAIWINFDDEGKKILTPLSSSSDTIKQHFVKYYSSIESKILALGYEYMSHYSYKPAHGTLLDFAYGGDCLSFEVHLDNTTSITTENVSQLSYNFYEILLVAIQEHNVYVTQINSSDYETFCTDSNCTYKSIDTFSMMIWNTKISNYSFTLNFYPGYEEPTGYSFFNSSVSTLNTLNNLTTSNLIETFSIDGQDTNRKTQTILLPGFTFMNITFNYIRNSSSKNSLHKYHAEFITTLGTMYWGNMTIDEKEEDGDNSDKEDDDGGDHEEGDKRRKAMITGLILLIILLILLLIAGIILCCRRKRQPDMQANFNPDPNFAQNPRI